ncbi:MAG: diguanylate cyclase [Alphaproteobacteria bacterium]|nr:diguanylate cyclase [Alphaproteobacteria bacterium]
MWVLVLEEGPPKMMYFIEDLELARTYGGNAMVQMGDLQVPATPNNYAIWYVYHSGHTPDLKRDVDTLIESKETITPERTNEIFDRYFGNAAEGQALRDTGQGLEAAISKLIGFLSEAGTGTEEYGNALEQYSTQLVDTASAEEARAIVTAILGETKNMAERQINLRAELAASTQEIEMLREGIRDAQREAMTDALTGIANRKALSERLTESIEEVEETGVPMCVLMLDIDFFKRFNDSYGHLLGDQVLRLVARTLTECIKGRDLAARYGGEEFLIVLPATSIENAIKLANHIRETVAGKRIINRTTGESLGQITLSIGTSRYRLGEDSEALIKRADEALYAAKRSGRNCVLSENELSASAVA